MVELDRVDSLFALVRGKLVYEVFSLCFAVTIWKYSHRNVFFIQNFFFILSSNFHEYFRSYSSFLYNDLHMQAYIWSDRFEKEIQKGKSIHSVVAELDQKPKLNDIMNIQVGQIWKRNKKNLLVI